MIRRLLGVAVVALALLPAIANAQFSGSFGGVGPLQSQQPQSQPPPPCSAPVADACKYGYNTVTFSTNGTWSNVIDYNNTQNVTAYQWFTYQSFSKACCSPQFDWLISGGAGPSTNYEVVNGVLEMAYRSGGVVAPNTCAYNPSAGIVKGRAFGGGYLVDIYTNFIQPEPANQGSWPGIYTLTYEYLNGAAGDSSGQPYYMERDVFEAEFGSPVDTAFHMWQNAEGGNFVIVDDLSAALRANNPTANSQGNAFYGNNHHYQMLWVPAAHNGGTGIFSTYVDGALMIQRTYTSSGMIDNGVSYGNYSGVSLVSTDSQHDCFRD